MSHMTTVERVKLVVKFVVASSVGFVVQSLLKTYTPTNGTTFNKVRLTIGAYTIAGVAAEKAIEWTHSEIDNAIDLYHQLKYISVTSR